MYISMLGQPNWALKGFEPIVFHLLPFFLFCGGKKTHIPSKYSIITHKKVCKCFSDFPLGKDYIFKSLLLFINICLDPHS